MKMRTLVGLLAMLLDTGVTVYAHDPATAPSGSPKSDAVPAGYWTEAQSGAVLAKVGTVRLAPDLSALTPGERAVIDDLLAAGRIVQDLYENARHHQALQAREDLTRLDERLGHPTVTRNLLALYRLSQGPIATTLDNKREPFLPVNPQAPARNVYPIDASAEEIAAFLGAHPAERASILGERTVVRRATAESLRADRAALARHPVLDTLHPGLAAKLDAQLRAPDRAVFYAVPYAVAYADETVKLHALLRGAADKAEADDAELAAYLRNRARDLLANDYESGDASWVTGRFKRLNAQIGAYETYDDPLFGVKAFYSLSVLVQDDAATAALRRTLTRLQAFEDALPYTPRKRVKDDVPVGVYDVIADFGQARGTNTATILPNDALYSRRYGRTILLRRNIMEHPEIFASNQRAWRAATLEAHADDLVPAGNTDRTLWHEIGHYLGPDRDQAGRTLDVALGEYADAMEEMKADLVSLDAHHRMHEAKAADDRRLRAVQASGILRTLQNAPPRRDQPYQTMQLIQFNWFVEHGLLVPDPQSARLAVRYEKYRTAVAALLEQVLALQSNGDKAAAARFFDHWTQWVPERHGRLAERIREAQGVRWRIVRYAALGE